MARSDKIFFAEWEKLGKMKYSDFYCAYAGASSNVAVPCRGIGCHKFGMLKDITGHIIFVGCADRLPFKRPSL